MMRLMGNRLFLIAKYIMVLGLAIRIYDLLVYYLITVWGGSFATFLGPKLFWDLAIFPINLIALPFIYFFVYKVTRKYLLNNPVLTDKSSNISFLVWVIILGLLYGYLESTIINVIAVNNPAWLQFYETINQIGIFGTLAALIVIFIASQKKPSTYDHVIGFMASSGLLILLLIAPIVGGAISG